MADADSSTFDSQRTSGSHIDEFAPYNDLRRHAHDDLVHLAEDLGLQPDDNASSDALRALIAARIELLRATPIDVLRELVVWGGRAAPAEATRMSLAREIRSLRRFDYDTLSHDGLVALAQLRGIAVDPKDHAEKIINRLNEAGGFWGKVDRQRRKVIGRFLEKMIDGVDDDDAQVARAQAESAARAKNACDGRSNPTAWWVVSPIACAARRIRISKPSSTKSNCASMPSWRRSIGGWPNGAIARSPTV